MNRFMPLVALQLALSATLAHTSFAQEVADIRSGDNIHSIQFQCLKSDQGTEIKFEILPSFAAQPNVEARWPRLEMKTGKQVRTLNFSKVRSSDTYIFTHTLSASQKEFSFRILINHYDDPAIYAAYPDQFDADLPTRVDVDIDTVCDGFVYESNSL